MPPTLDHRPCILRPAESRKAWGTELWLTSTRPEGRARIEGGDATLEGFLSEHPEALGRWARLLYGDEKPIFTKTIVTHFPPRVHLGFRRDVDAGELRSWLGTEQARMRELLGALNAPTPDRFAAYEAKYAAWASRQAVEGWRLDDDAEAAAMLKPYCRDSFAAAPWVRRLRENRAAFVDALHEVDLRREAGNLLLSGAGLVHAIFGLSHQTHPADHTRSALEGLFGRLARLVVDGAGDAELERAADEAGLPALRRRNIVPPKNEAWLPLLVGDALVLVEPQQTSDTTYSIADFYTPIVWGNEGPRFRKGDARTGLSDDDLDRFVRAIDRRGTALEALRRSPRAASAQREPTRELEVLVDEPAAWPFFAAYQMRLSGSATLLPPAFVFQEIVVVQGRVELADASGSVGELTPERPAFIPGTLAQPYILSAREPSRLLFFGVPGPRGGAPRML